MIWFLPPPPPPISSISPTGDTREESETIFLRERGEGVGEEPNQTMAKKPGTL
jgi:hypothetical protein